MSVARFGSNIVIDGGGGVGSALYNATVMNRLHQLSMSDAGSAAVSDVARRLRSLRIVPPSAPQSATDRDVVMYYVPSSDVDGKRLLDALVLATPSATSGATPDTKPRVPAMQDLPATKLMDSSGVSLGREGVDGPKVRG